MGDAPWRDPFFWAALSLLGVIAGDAIVANVLPRSRALGLAVVASVMGSRAVLVLPFCPQPRFDLGGGELPLGVAVMALGAVFAAPVLRVGWTTGPKPTEGLRTTGVYGWVRHPGYLGNVLLALGWAVCFGSTVGVLLTPVWWLGFWLHALIEEGALERAYGPAYRDYVARVRTRILPWPHGPRAIDLPSDV